MSTGNGYLSLFVHCPVKGSRLTLIPPNQYESIQLCTACIRCSRCSGRRHNQCRLHECFVAASAHTDAVAGMNELGILPSGTVPLWNGPVEWQFEECLCMCLNGFVHPR